MNCADLTYCQATSKATLIGTFVVSTFTGKERDEETGYSYFGARCYVADLLTGLLSADPLSDKYPSLSSYNYRAWNPLFYLDLDGCEINDNYGWWKDKLEKMHWDPTIHNQQELDNTKGFGNTWMGLTFESEQTYYSLFGDQISKKSELQKPNLLFTKQMDKLCQNVQTAYNNGNLDYISPVSFSNIFRYDKYDQNTHSTNIKSDRLQKYAQGRVGVVIFVSSNMNGYFLEDMRQTQPKTVSWGMGGYERNSLIKGWNVLIRDKGTQQIIVQLAFPTLEERKKIRELLQIIVQ